MNRIILLFCCLFLSLSQKVVSQEITNITIDFEEQSLRSALYKLEEVSQIRFIFQDEVSDTLTVTNQRFEYKILSQILHTLLANTSYSYIVIGRFRRYEVVIFRTSGTTQKQESTPIMVKGKVLDERAFPQSGAVIRRRREDGIIPLTNREGQGVLANMEGYFEIMVDNLNTYLVVTTSVHLPRVVHIKDAELIQLEFDEVTYEWGIW